MVPWMRRRTFDCLSVDVVDVNSCLHLVKVTHVHLIQVEFDLDCVFEHDELVDECDFPSGGRILTFIP